MTTHIALIHIVLLVIFIVSVAIATLIEVVRTAFAWSNRIKAEAVEGASAFTRNLLSKIYRAPLRSLTSYRAGYILMVFVVSAVAFFSGLTLSSHHMDISLLVFLAICLISVSIILIPLTIFLPRVVAFSKPNEIINRLALPAYLFSALFSPLGRFASEFGHLLMLILKRKDVDMREELSAENEDVEHMILRSIDSEQYNKEEESEMKILRNAIDFSNIRVRDCLIPRTEIVAVEHTDTIDEVLKVFADSGKSKIMVYEENLDHILGYIHTGDLFHHYSNWRNHIRDIAVVPESMSADNLLKLFSQEKKGLALVVDEFGGTVGIVSTEDIVEEILGDIEDEHDTENYTAQRLKDGEFLLSARLEIAKINELFDTELPESDEYMTAGGLIIDHAMHIPKPGEVVNVGHYSFKILKGSSTKIELVKLTDKSIAPEQADEGKDTTNEIK